MYSDHVIALCSCLDAALSIEISPVEMHDRHKASGRFSCPPSSPTIRRPVDDSVSKYVSQYGG